MQSMHGCELLHLRKSLDSQWAFTSFKIPIALLFLDEEG